MGVFTPDQVFYFLQVCMVKPDYQVRNYSKMLNRNNMPKENSFFSNDDTYEENSGDLKLDIEIMKLKMQAEFGAVFGSSGEIPPDIEKQFLQDVFEIEKNMNSAGMVTVFKFIGEPTFSLLKEMCEEDVPGELDRLYQVLESNDLSLVSFHNYPPSVIYQFITEELFLEEIENYKLPGMMGVFVYENFHPNHESEIREITIDFLGGWQALKWEDMWRFLFSCAVLPDGTTLTEDEFKAKLAEQSAKYSSLQMFEFSIENIQFEWKDEVLGLGFSEGKISYLAILKSGLTRYSEGSFKCYFCNNDGYWRISSFCLPGFDW
jgi:hypothetical protein